MYNIMTRRTRDTLLERLEHIRQQRFRLCEELEDAAGFGDLRENAEFDAAMERQGMLNREAENIRCRLSNMILLEEMRVNGKTVTIGTAVTLQNIDGVRTYIIVGCLDDEVPVTGIKATYNSTLAKALLGNTIGAIVMLPSQGALDEFKVVDIKRIFDVGDAL